MSLQPRYQTDFIGDWKWRAVSNYTWTTGINQDCRQISSYSHLYNEGSWSQQNSAIFASFDGKQNRQQPVTWAMKSQLCFWCSEKLCTKDSSGENVAVLWCQALCDQQQLGWSRLHTTTVGVKWPDFLTYNRAADSSDFLPGMSPLGLEGGGSARFLDPVHEDQE